MGYAVYHTEKGINQASVLGNHIDRNPNARHTFYHANLSLSKNNRDFTEDPYRDMDLHKAVEVRIREGYKQDKAIRKDAVRYLKHVLTASHSDMIRISEDPKQLDKWIESNKLFIEREFGENNIVRFTLHMDEKTPHIHAVTVPLTRDGRLSAKEIIGDAKQMRERQTRYAMAMHRFGLERGLEQTGIKHESAKQYYARINSLTKESAEEKTKYEKLAESLDDATVFNFKNKIKQFRADLSDEVGKNNSMVGYDVLKQNRELKLRLKEVNSAMNGMKIAKGIKELKTRCTILDYFTSLASRGVLRFDGKRGAETYFALPTQNSGSIAVNEQKGVYYDHSSGKGGDVLKAMNDFEGVSLAEAIRLDVQGASTIKKIADKFYSSNKIKTTKPLDEGFEVTAEMNKITHPALKQYLSERGFTPEDVKGVFNEVHWYDKKEPNKRFFALGMPIEQENTTQGYVVRNAYFKGNKGKISPKAININGATKNSNVKVFEGVFDLLAYKKMAPKHSFMGIVLNGVTQLKKIIPTIEKYLNDGRQIQTYFDNDTAGEQCYKELVKEFPMECSNGQLKDSSRAYREVGIKDLCEYMNYKNSTKQPKRGDNRMSL